MSFPHPGCGESETSGRSVGTHLSFCPYLLPRTFEPVVSTPHPVGVGANAQGTGRSKSQTNKTPVYSPTAVMDCLVLQPKVSPSTQRRLKQSLPYPHHSSPQLSRQGHCTFFFFFSYFFNLCSSGVDLEERSQR